VQQFNLVDYGIAFAGVDLPDDRAEAAPVVQDIIDRRGLYIRHLKVDVLPDLPQKQFQRIFVPLSLSSSKCTIPHCRTSSSISSA